MSKWYDLLPDYNYTERCNACGGFLFYRKFIPAHFEGLEAHIRAICKDCGAPHAEKLYMDSKK